MPEPKLVPLVHLVPPPEPLRVAMGDEAMAELESSIGKIGQLFPLLVIPKYRDANDNLVDAPIARRHKGPADVDCYEIVDGHRRFVALERLKIPSAHCMVFENAADVKHAMMLDANVCREDVTPFEEGVQFLELAEKHQWSMDQLMRVFQRSEDYINDRVDIVRKDQGVAEAVRDRRINIGQAKEVLKAPDLTSRQILLEQAAVHGATIKGLREMRHNMQREAAIAQGALPMNAPAWAEPPAIIAPDVCCWCGRDEEQYHLVTIRVHQYELADLRAVLDKFSRRALLAQLDASRMDS
jgi:ParB/RepB/Spo0J family partition protein